VSDKYLIGIGCSYTQGQGGVTEHIYQKYGNEVFNGNHRLPIDAEERQCSWVGQICEKHLQSYTPINLGQRGRGNRSAAKELYLNRLDSKSEKIVVYALSGMERFDFPNKDATFANHHFYSMFPTPNNKEKPLWSAYAEHVWSDQFIVIETILNILEVQNWCKLNNAKLLLTSAFCSDISREYFRQHLNHMPSEVYLADLVDWDLFWRPDGYDSFLHMMLDLQENGSDEVNDLKHGSYWSKYIGKFPPKEYITPCNHPTYKSHKIIAEKMYLELKRRNYV
jgi:hypothetical protein